jgi:hypothetical protein
MSDQFDPPGADPGDPAAPADLSADSSSAALVKEEALAKEGDDPLPWDAGPPPADDGPCPWDADPPRDDPDAPRQRHDAFTEARKSVWLRALVKTGCVVDACRLTDISPRTIYRHQQNDPSFFENCRIALRVSGTPAELTAWSRAVEGVEQEFACGGQVHIRRRYSDGLLRLLLQSSNPKKYGSNPGFKRKRLLKYERKQIEREVRAELEAKIAEKGWSFDEAMVSLDRQLERMDVDGLMGRYSPGWTKTEDGHWIPPGYGWIGLPEGAAAPDAPVAEAGEGPSGPSTPRDSM